MYIYPSLYIGNYFIFLLSADDIAPVKIYFKDHETSIGGKKPLPHSKNESTGGWKEKVYLYPALLQRKWIDYRHKDRFIPAVSYDNIMPIELRYPFFSAVNDQIELRLKTGDKNYKSVILQLLNENKEEVFEKVLPPLTVNKERSCRFSLSMPGVYTICLLLDEGRFLKTEILVYRKKSMCTPDVLIEQSKSALRFSFYCTACGARIYPVTGEIIDEFIHKNYIPFKEYLDIEGIGLERISAFIRTIDHPKHFKQGLIHLLNILRLASLSDELTVVTNLFRDDTPFAHYITDKLFLFDMLPIMPDRELQMILNRIDDDMLAHALHGSGKEIRAKILNNISRRRGRSIMNDLQLKIKEEVVADAKSEVHRSIKSFFEERFGRELKIPYATRSIYRVKNNEDFLENVSLNEMLLHTGVTAVFDGQELMLLDNKQGSFSDENRQASPINGASPINDTGRNHETFVHEQYMSKILHCYAYDYETSGDAVLSITGVTESSIYMLSMFGIRYARIHIYNWLTSLEDTEALENITRRSIIPLRLPSSCFVLTIGAVDGKRKPHEQVIRVKVRQETGSGN